jgi:hypothetical protein
VLLIYLRQVSARKSAEIRLLTSIYPSKAFEFFLLRGENVFSTTKQVSSRSYRLCHEQCLSWTVPAAGFMSSRRFLIRVCGGRYPSSTRPRCGMGPRGLVMTPVTHICIEIGRSEIGRSRQALVIAACPGRCYALAGPPLCAVVFSAAVSPLILRKKASLSRQKHGHCISWIRSNRNRHESR